MPSASTLSRYSRNDAMMGSRPRAFNSRAIAMKGCKSPSVPTVLSTTFRGVFTCRPAPSVDLTSSGPTIDPADIPIWYGRHSMARKMAYLVLAVCVAVLALIAVNTLRSSSRQTAVARLVPPAVDAGAAAQRLAGAVRFRTISYETPSDASRAELLRLHSYLQDAFPHALAATQREVINTYSLLYTWPGRDFTARPIVLMAHQDVVPIAPGSETQWHAGPFSGEIKDGFIWGRGAWDDKGNLMAILEAVDSLAASGFKPERTIYLA